MNEPKRYEFASFQELLDRVPSDRIVECMTELAQGFALAKQILEISLAIERMSSSLMEIVAEWDVSPLELAAVRASTIV